MRGPLRDPVGGLLGAGRSRRETDSQSKQVLLLLDLLPRHEPGEPGDRAGVKRAGGWVSQNGAGQEIEGKTWELLKQDNMGFITQLLTVDKIRSFELIKDLF